MLANLTRHKALLFSLLIMLLIVGRNVISQGQDLVAANLSNPDSYQKLVMVRDHAPETGFNFVARDNAPHGFWMHWSLPHTWLTWTFHKGLIMLGLEQQTALLVAGAGLTMLSMLLLIALVTMTLANIGSPKAALLGAMAIASNPPLHGYGQLLQITHHIFMLVPVAAAAACFLRQTRQAMPMADLTGGLLLGLALWISPETMPLVIAMAGMRAAIRLQHTASGAVWPVALGLMLMLLAGWHLDPPPPTFTAWALDHISYSWLLLGALLSMLLIHTDLCVARKLGLIHAASELSMLFLLAILSWLWIVPDALHGAEGLIPAYLHEVWYSLIQELQPANTPAKAIGYLLLPIVGGGLLLWTAWRERSLWMLVLALSTLIYAVLVSGHVRMGAAGGLMACLAFGLASSRMHGVENMHDATLPKATQLKVILLILVIPMQVLVPLALEQAEENKVSSTKNNSVKSCELEHVLPTLNSLPSGVVLASTNLGPEILFKTHHHIIAGNYHHNLDGLTDNFRMLRDTPPDRVARVLAEQRGVDYLLVCTNVQPGLDVKASLAQRAAAGEPISWLPRHLEEGGWKIYFRN